MFSLTPSKCCTPLKMASWSKQSWTLIPWKSKKFLPKSYVLKFRAWTFELNIREKWQQIHSRTNKNCTAENHGICNQKFEGQEKCQELTFKLSTVMPCNVCPSTFEDSKIFMNGTKLETVSQSKMLLVDQWTTACNTYQVKVLIGRFKSVTKLFLLDYS